MSLSYSHVVGADGAIAKSGKTIYDFLHDSPEHFLPATELESVLRAGLIGLDLNYPLRTRSKVLKSKICEILGYPIPKSFKKSQPRFLGQNFDTYIQKSNNLQIWNEEISPTRRYVMIRLDEFSKVVGLRVVTGEVIAKLDLTGTLTKKYQARSREPVTTSVLVSQSDSYAVGDLIAKHLSRVPTTGQSAIPEKVVNLANLLPIPALYTRLLQLVGTRFSDPGIDQERNRGAALHRAVCDILGIEKCDTGSFPDVLEQLLELKLQTSPTIDLGLVSPDDFSSLEFLPGVKHRDVRYGIFYGTIIGDEVRIDHLVLTRGQNFFTFFQRFEGKVTNAKLQIPLPRNFFD